MIYFYVLTFLLSPIHLAFGKSSIQAYPVWAINTLKNRKMTPNLHIQSSPILYKKLVIQGNAHNGIKAFTKKSGRQIWDYKINGGISSSVHLYKDNLYFGAGDGFFYSLRAEDGKLLWKFFTGSDNTGAPLLRNQTAYFVSSNQKVYALSIKNGKLLWIHSGSNLSNELRVRGQARPFAFQEFLYVGFSDGSVSALNQETGRLMWNASIKSSAPIFSDLSSSRRCLLVPVFEEGLYCLNFKNGKIVWRTKLGGSTKAVVRKNRIYQGALNRLQVLKRKSGKKVRSFKVKGLPVTPSFYKNFILYGSLSNGSLRITNRANRKKTTSFYFGKGLSAPVTIDKKMGEAYFITAEGYLRKVKLVEKKL